MPVTLLSSALVLPMFAALAQSPATARPRAVEHAAHTGTSARTACAKVPELSPKIPAIPAGSPCARSLYTLTTVPNVKFDYISPLEGSVLRETLGIESTSFSLDYIDTKVGTGELALPHKWYSIQYTGYLVDGTKFDSSYDHPDHEPFTFQYGEHQVVAGWDTGFAGMRVGGKRRLFIPYQLAYGPQGHGMIPPKSMLVFDVELVAVSNQKPAPKLPATPAGERTPTPPPAQPGAASKPESGHEGTAPAASTLPSTTAKPQ